MFAKLCRWFLFSVRLYDHCMISILFLMRMLNWAANLVTYSTERNIWIHLPGFCESSLLHRLGVLNSGNVLIGQTSLLTLRQSPIINLPRECGGRCGDVHDVVRSTAVHWSRPRLILIFTDLNSWSWKKCLITQSGIPYPKLRTLKSRTLHEFMLCKWILL